MHGRLNSSEWETSEGEKRFQLEIRADRVSFLDRTVSDLPEASDDAVDEEEDLETAKK